MKSTSQKEIKRLKKFAFPENACGAKTKKNLAKAQKNLMQLEDVLKVMIVLLLQKKLKHIVSKEAMNIDGLGKKLLISSGT